MQLSYLLGQRSALLPGELVTIGTGVAQAASAIVLQGGSLLSISPDDVWILSDGAATLTDEFRARCQIPEGGAAALRLGTADMPGGAAAPIANLLRTVLTIIPLKAGATGVVEVVEQLGRHVNFSDCGNQMIGDFALGLAGICEPAPISVTDPTEPNKWLPPTLLGLVALASWGVALGLLVRV